VPEGDEVTTFITEEARKAGYKNAAVQVHGALSRGSISAMNETGLDVRRDFKKPMEVTGTGDLVEGRLHLHVSIGSAVPQEGTRTGHLIIGHAGEMFIAYLIPATATMTPGAVSEIVRTQLNAAQK
jgi:uncharacterized protein